MINDEVDDLKDTTAQLEEAARRAAEQPDATPASMIPIEDYLTQMIKLNNTQRRNTLSILDGLRAPVDQGSADVRGEFWDDEIEEIDKDDDVDITGADAQIFRGVAALQRPRLRQARHPIPDQRHLQGDDQADDG